MNLNDFDKRSNSSGLDLVTAMVDTGSKWKRQDIVYFGDFTSVLSVRKIYQYDQPLKKNCTL